MKMPFLSTLLLPGRQGDDLYLISENWDLSVLTILIKHFWSSSLLAEKVQILVLDQICAIRNEHAHNQELTLRKVFSLINLLEELPNSSKEREFLQEARAEMGVLQKKINERLSDLL